MLLHSYSTFEYLTTMIQAVYFICIQQGVCLGSPPSLYHHLRPDGASVTLLRIYDWLFYLWIWPCLSGIS